MSLVEAYKFFLSRWHRSIAPFTKFFMASKPNIVYVFERPSDNNSYGVQSWAKRINITEARRCQVMSIDHRKAGASKEHEFLYIRLRYPPGHETYMITERFVDIGSRSSSTLAMASSSPPTPAKDVIRFADEPYDDSYSLRRWTFDGELPSVADLCAVMYAVSERGDRYTAFEHQCFWFAGVVYDVMKAEFSGMVIVGQPRKQGTYKKLPMPSADIAENVRAVRGSYKQMWREFLAATAAERDALEPARAEARHKGLQEGREEGLAAGRAASAAEIAELRRLLAVQGRPNIK